MKNITRNKAAFALLLSLAYSLHLKVHTVTAMLNTRQHY